MGFTEIKTGLGDEFDIENNELDAIFVGSDNISVPDDNNPGQNRDATYYQFNLNGETVFVWGSYSLDQAFAATDPNDRTKPAIQYGDRVLVEYKGKKLIKNGAQTVRQYSVQKWSDEPVTAGKK